MNAPSHSVTRLRDRFREETATAILAAAEAVIGERGLQEARMEQIAGTAGVSVGTLYNHFKDREAMLRALRESRIGQLRNRIAAALVDVRGAPARVQIRGYLSAVAAHGLQHGRFLTALMQEQLGPSSVRAPARAQAALLPAARELLDRAVAAGELREDPDGIRADALVALARLLLVRTVEGLGGEAEIDAFTDLFLSGAAR